MEKEVSKKTGVILLFVGIIIAVAFTFVIISYIQTPKVVEVEGPSESASSGEITLTIEKPPKVKDEGAGSVSLTVLPPTGEE
jgi:hypothetical protein|tara:strand:+ start:48 stop:293 length:246 start_codon:yes stop_codon:yes gene_type:complete